MKHFWRSACILAAFVLVACQGPQNGSPPVVDDPDSMQPAGVIEGKLLGRSGEPLAGAQVTLRGGVTSLSASSVELAAVGLATTNAAGEFAFDVENEGEYNLTALLGNEGAFAWVSVSRGPDGKLSSTPVSLQAAELGGVTGKVARGGPGAWVFLLGTSFLASTDATGSFVISGVPAGTYDLAAGVLGAVGSPVKVTVAAGSVTAVATQLALGPTISGTQPSGITYFDYLYMREPAELRIFGSGFGSVMGTSVVRYAGTDVTDFVSSWGDDEIVMHLDLISYPVMQGWATLPAADFVMEVATQAGVARSAPMGHYRAEILPSALAYCELFGSIAGDDIGYVRPYLANAPGPLGATFALTVTNATLFDPVTRQPTNSAVVESSGCAPFGITRRSPTSPPAYVTATISGHEFVAPHLVEGLFWAPGVEFDGWNYAVGPNTVTGTFRDLESGLAIEGDAHFSARASATCDWNDQSAPSVPLAMAVNQDGAFSFELDIASEPGCAKVTFYYRAVEVDSHLLVGMTD